MDYNFTVTLDEKGFPQVKTEPDALDKLADLVSKLPETELATDQFQEHYFGLTAGFMGDCRLEILDQKLAAKIARVIPLIQQKQDGIYTQAELVALDEPAIIQKDGQEIEVKMDYSASKEKIVGLKLKELVSSDGYQQLPPESQAKYFSKAKVHLESIDPRRLVFEAIKQDLIRFTRIYSLVLEEGEINPFKNDSSREFWDQHWGTGKALDGLLAGLEGLYRQGEEEIQRREFSLPPYQDQGQ